MLSCGEYAKKHNLNLSTVRVWCQKGLIEGVTKIPCSRSSYMYAIPEDAPPPVTTRIWSQAVPGRQYTKREISLFIRKHAGNMTYGDISRTLGISTLECRAIYDRLHRRYHI